jgi:hypothetical protein
MAPQNLYRPQPQFAHDEVRRYATAIHLVRTEQIVATLQAVGAPRWALSASALACKGQLVDPDRRPTRRFPELVSGFNDVACARGSRWADVPIEAVLETPFAYECLVAAIGTEPTSLHLADVLRVVSQRFTFDGSIDPSIGAPVVQFLIWACPVLTDIQDQGTWGLREDVHHHGEHGEEAGTASSVVHA